MQRPLLGLATENFRSLREIEVELKPLNVFVGPNESGKSNFLDLIRFLADSVRSDLSPAIAARGGYERVRFRGKPTGPVTIRVSANVTRYSNVNAPDEYSLTFWQRRMRARVGEHQPRKLLLRRESFRFKRTRGRGRRITIQGDRVEVVDTQGGEETTHNIGLRSDSLGLATLPRLSPEDGGDEIARIADMFATFRVFDLNVSEARKPSRVDAGPLRDDGSNLASFLLGLRDDDTLFSDLLADARAMIPGLVSIDFEDVGGSSGATAIKLVEDGLSDKTDLADASLGTIRVLALLSPVPPRRLPLPLDRHRPVDVRALAGRAGADVEGAAEFSRAAAHVRQPAAAYWFADADPVIHHIDGDIAIADSERHVQAGGVGVPGGVGQALPQASFSSRVSSHQEEMSTAMRGGFVSSVTRYPTTSSMPSP